MTTPNDIKIDPHETLVIFPKHIGWTLILGCGAIGALGLAVMPIAWSDGDWGPFVAGVFLILIGFGLAVALIVKRSKDETGPTMTLSPKGLEVHQNTKGVVPWPEVQRISHMTVRATTMLLVHITPEALARLKQTTFQRRARKLDAAFGLNTLTFHQQNFEMPLPLVEGLLHTYSVTHGGPVLLADP